MLDEFLSGVNTLGIEGRLPAAYGEVLAERHSDYTEQFSVGDEVTVPGMQCKVVGIASNPLIFDRLGALFLWAVLGYLGFGSLADVKWYTYFLAFGIMMLFTGVTDLILSPKILGIDMTGSLKAND